MLPSACRSQARQPVTQTAMSGDLGSGYWTRGQSLVAGPQRVWEAMAAQPEGCAVCCMTSLHTLVGHSLAWAAHGL